VTKVVSLFCMNNEIRGRKKPCLLQVRLMSSLSLSLQDLSRTTGLCTAMLLPDAIAIHYYVNGACKNSKIVIVTQDK